MSATRIGAELIMRVRRMLQAFPASSSLVLRSGLSIVEDVVHQLLANLLLQGYLDWVEV